MESPLGAIAMRASPSALFMPGVGGYHCRGSRHAIPWHTLSMMNPEEPHNGYALTERLRYTMLYISEEALRRQLDQAQLKGFKTLNGADPGGYIEAGLVKVLKRLLHPPHAGWQLAFESELSELLLRVFVTHGQVQPAPVRPSHPAVSRTRCYLEESARRLVAGEDVTVSLQQLADREQVHPNYLLRLFKSASGLTPYAFWLQRRVVVARELLQAGHTAAAVAQHTGFHDQAHFIRAFRHVTGVTPGRYILHCAQ